MNGQAQQNKVRPPPGIMQQQDQTSHDINNGSGLKLGRDLSPSCSVTGTTTSSRSVSPSWNQTFHSSSNDPGRRGSIPFHNQADLSMHPQGTPGQGQLRSRMNMNFNENRAFSNSNLSAGRHDSSNALDSSYDLNLNGGSFNGRSGSHGSGHFVSRQPQPHAMNDMDYHNNVPATFSSPNLTLGGELNNGNGMGGNNAMRNGGITPYQQQQQQQQMPDLKPQQQVFYMAVPTQDGQGQVLQPIRMVQLPGQPNAFVLPASATNSASPNLVATNGNVPSMMMQSTPGGGLLDHTKMEQQALGQVNNPRILSHNNMSQYDHRHRSGSGGSTPYGHHNHHRHNVHSGNKSPHHTNNSINQQHYERGSFNNDMKGGLLSSSPGDLHGQPVRINNNRGQSEFPMERSNHKNEGSLSSSTSNGDFVATLYASPQRPPLQDLLGHVRRLSRDQVGCRLLQQSLDEEGPAAATQILNEGLTFWGEAMVDPFGNYLFQKILEKITPKERVVLIKNVSTRLVNASLNLHGTRSVQKVVELCAIDETASRSPHVNEEVESETAAEVLTRALAPAAARLCIDSHGNHVIQRILLKLPYHYSQFVFDAVASSVGDVARHRHGCCVIQRCLDSPPSAARSNLVRRIVEKALELMQDAYGNYVVQYVLDVCSDEDVHSVCESVVGKVCLLAIQKFSSNVMEKCLERCTDRVRELYLKELSETDRIRELMTDPFGNYVIQRALAVATHSQAVQLVETMRPHLMSTVPVSGSNSASIKNSAGGRRIMAKISRRFPNFNLGNNGLEDHPAQKHNEKFRPNNHGVPSPSRMNQYDHQNQYSRHRNRHGSRKLDTNAYGVGNNNGRYFHM